MLRYEPHDEGFPGAAAWHVMYLSESVQGDTIAVTGTVLIPEADATTDESDAGRPVLSIAHGTTGVADGCAPSKDPLGTELTLAGDFVEDGFVVAMTDYEGLGTPGRHPYLVGESQGRGVLDAATAAGQLPDANLGGELAVFGYSQGGHAALWAHELADEWAPEFELVGTVAGAPPSEMSVLTAGARALDGARGFLMMILAGYAEAYPEADLSLVLTADGEEALSAVDEGCVGDVIGAFAADDFRGVIKPDVADVEPWSTLWRENDPGQTRTDAPILITHSQADTVVPAALSELLFERLCGLGQVVERRVYTEGRDHVESAVQEAAPDGYEWITARFAGVAATSNC